MTKPLSAFITAGVTCFKADDFLQNYSLNVWLHHTEDLEDGKDFELIGDVTEGDLKPKEVCWGRYGLFGIWLSGDCHSRRVHGGDESIGVGDFPISFLEFFPSQESKNGESTNGEKASNGGHGDGADVVEDDDDLICTDDEPAPVSSPR